MRKLIVLVTFMILISFSGLLAQPRFDINKQMEMLKSELNLTQVQSDSIKIVLKDMRARMTEMRDNSDGDRREMWGKMREIINESENKIKSYLTDDQKAKYEKLMEERRKNRPRRSRN